MSHFAKVEDGIVTQIIVAEQDFIDTLPDSASWIQTSYNTYGNEHRLGGEPLRKNYAGIGYTYNTVLDAFIPPKPEGYNSWTLNEEIGLWDSPTPRPTDGNLYDWDELNQQWVVKVE